MWILRAASCYCERTRAAVGVAASASGTLAQSSVRRCLLPPTAMAYGQVPSQFCSIARRRINGAQSRGSARPEAQRAYSKQQNTDERPGRRFFRVHAREHPRRERLHIRKLRSTAAGRETTTQDLRPPDVWNAAQEQQSRQRSHLRTPQAARAQRELNLAREGSVPDASWTPRRGDQGAHRELDDKARALAKQQEIQEREADEQRRQQELPHMLIPSRETRPTITRTTGSSYGPTKLWKRPQSALPYLFTHSNRSRPGTS